MTWAVVVLGGAYVYAAIAGLTAKRLGCPPRCRGTNTDAMGACRCYGWTDPYGPCDDCRTNRRVVLGSLLWPIAWLPWSLCRVMRAAMDLGATPSQDVLDERQEKVRHP